MISIIQYFSMHATFKKSNNYIGPWLNPAISTLFFLKLQKSWLVSAISAKLTVKISLLANTVKLGEW